MDKYAVWGNPIAQSKSPFIHRQFAYQTKQVMHYDAIICDEKNFAQEIRAFFNNNGMGCNITSPFKEQAYQLATSHSKRCQIAQSCNTLKKLPDGSLFADNTDGAGLITDLTRLNWLTPNQEILILGAGGATKGVLYPLLGAKQKIVIANRTENKAQQLADKFSSYGNVTGVGLDNLPLKHFALIINATSSGLQGEVVSIDQRLFAMANGIYDMQYSISQDTPFIQLAKHCHANNVSDGLGMLVAQASHSFELWRGIKPNIESLIERRLLID